MSEIKEIEQLGRKQTAATKAKISKAVMGKDNPAWVDGHHPDHYRRVAGAKPGDGMIVHHKDENRSDNKPSNLKKVSASKHNKIHHRENNFKK